MLTSEQALTIAIGLSLILSLWILGALGLALILGRIIRYRDTQTPQTPPVQPQEPI